MMQWARQHRTTILTLVMLLILARLVLDGLAAFGVFPPFGQDHVSDLAMFGLAATALFKDERQGARDNWAARHPRWISVILLALVLGATWTGAALERAWHTPLGSRLIPDMLYALAVVLWIKSLARRRSPLLPT